MEESHLARYWFTSCIYLWIISVASILIHSVLYRFSRNCWKVLSEYRICDITHTYNFLDTTDSAPYFLRDLPICEDFSQDQIVVRSTPSDPPPSQHLETLIRDVTAPVALFRHQTIIYADGVLRFVVLIVSRGREGPVNLRSRIRRRWRCDPYQPLTLGLTLRCRLSWGWAASGRGGMRARYSHP